MSRKLRGHGALGLAIITDSIDVCVFPSLSGPRVKDISSRIREQKFTTQREASVLKSDVWRYVRAVY